MKRHDVAVTIQAVGERFGQIMECLNSEEYAAGYRQAVRDMVRMFEYEPVAEEKHESKKFVLFGGARGQRDASKRVSGTAGKH